MNASEELEKALAKTTPGEWFAVQIADCYSVQLGPSYTDADVLNNDDYDPGDTVKGVPNPGDNADFIALAHNRLPELLAEVKQLRQGLDWRIGMATTPKMRTHPYYRHVGIIRQIHAETPNTKEQATIEIRFPDMDSIILLEPTDEWMAA